MFKLIPRTNRARIELSLKKTTPFFSLDLVKGLGVAVGIHLLFALLFHIYRPMQNDLLSPLCPVAVEIDKESLELKPVFLTTKTDLVMGHKPTLCFPEPPFSSPIMTLQKDPTLSLLDANFSSLEKRSYTTALETLDLSKKFHPVHLLLSPPLQALEFTPESWEIIEAVATRQGQTTVTRLLFEVTVHPATGKIKSYELEEQWGYHPKAMALAETIFEKITFEKSKEKDITGKLELWLEQSKKELR